MNKLKKIGKYEVYHPLGAGNFGSVFFVRDYLMGKDTAIKLIPINKESELNKMDFTEAKEILDKKIAEARTLGLFDSSNIIKINNCEILPYDGVLHLIIDMEYMKDGSVEKIMEESILYVYRSVRIIIKMLLGLQHAHLKKIIHKDVKPGNILLAGNFVKLSDFGHALFLGDSDFIISDTGYRTHLAPEVYRNGKSSIATDIYATGITLYRMVCGINGWIDFLQASGITKDDVQKGKVIKKLAYPQYIPNKIRFIINKCCNIDPQKRYRSAKLLRNALSTLKFNIDWHEETTNRWIGKSIHSDDLYSIEIVGKRTYTVFIKKNNRKQGKLIKKFNIYEDAKISMIDYIRETTLSGK